MPHWPEGSEVIEDYLVKVRCQVARSKAGDCIGIAGIETSEGLSLRTSVEADTVMESAVAVAVREWVERHRKNKKTDTDDEVWATVEKISKGKRVTQTQRDRALSQALLLLRKDG